MYMIVYMTNITSTIESPLSFKSAKETEEAPAHTLDKRDGESYKRD